MYRAVDGANTSLSTSPSPVVVDQTVRQAVPSPDNSTRYPVAYAASQRRITRPTVVAVPRSTRTHWSSLHPLLHRVPWSASTAAPVEKNSWVLDALTGRPTARLA